jgi:hypothetical protein
MQFCPTYALYQCASSDDGAACGASLQVLGGSCGARHFAALEGKGQGSYDFDPGCTEKFQESFEYDQHRTRYL